MAPGFFASCFWHKIPRYLRSCCVLLKDNFERIALNEIAAAQRVATCGSSHSMRGGASHLQATQECVRVCVSFHPLCTPVYASRFMRVQQPGPSRSLTQEFCFSPPFICGVYDDICAPHVHVLFFQRPRVDTIRCDVMTLSRSPRAPSIFVLASST